MIKAEDYELLSSKEMVLLRLVAVEWVMANLTASKHPDWVFHYHRNMSYSNTLSIFI